MVETTTVQSQLEAMAEAGLLYGRKCSKTNPKMRRYIFASRKGIEIFDLEQTAAMLAKAIDFMKDLLAKGGKLLMVGTQPAARELVQKFAAKHGFFYVTERWLGGTLTNFKTISSRLQYLKKLKSDRDSGQLDKYTKKEKHELQKYIDRFDKFFIGLTEMQQLPEAVFIVNPEEHLTAIREAKRLGIPVIAIISTDGDPDLITHPIPANANARLSIGWILDKIDAGITDKSEILNPESATNPSAQNPNDQK